MEKPATEKQKKFMQDLKINFMDGVTMKEAKYMIEKALNKEDDEEPQPQKSQSSKGFDSASMYVSYVKDLVISGVNPSEAIELIKKAKEAFS